MLECSPEFPSASYLDVHTAEAGINNLFMVYIIELWMHLGGLLKLTYLEVSVC